MENNDSFEYTYDPAQQAEVERIRKKYIRSGENKMEQLRQLDRSVTRKATSVSVFLGILGALIMGTGMSLTMTDLGAKLGAPAMVIGIGVGLAGMVLVALAYPVYNSIVKKERRRIAPQILQLTEELLK